MFSWAGVWGDLGLLGLIVYLALWFTVLRNFCPDDMSRFFVLCIMVFGVVFSWMEEPGYMLFVVALVGLRWQEYQSRESRKGPVYQKLLRERLLAGPYEVGASARPLPPD